MNLISVSVVYYGHHFVLTQQAFKNRSMEFEGWKVVGKAKGPGIPAPAGEYRVGCVDLMHQLPGDEENGGLLVRLTYPTEATPEAGYPYSSWYPHRRYIQGYMEFEEKDVAVSQDVIAKVISELDGGLLFSIMLTLNADPQMPALEGAPLYRTNAPGNSTALCPEALVLQLGGGGVTPWYT
jgi:hypothetical protein